MHIAHVVSMSEDNQELGSLSALTPHKKPGANGGPKPNEGSEPNPPNDGSLAPSHDPGVFRDGRSRWERVVSGLVVIATLAIAALVAIVYWDEYRVLLASTLLLPLVGAFAAGLVGQFLNVAIAHRSLSVEGTLLPLRAVYRIISVGGLAKYIPGGVWQIGSQAGLGRAAGLTFRHSMLAWIEPTAFNITVGGGLALLAATQVDYGIPTLFLLLGAAAAFLASTNRIRYAIYRLIRLIPKNRQTPPSSLGGWVSQFSLTGLVVALTGLGGVLITSAFGLQSEVSFVGSVAAFVGAWVIGFLAFPIPGGIGVREGALVFALAPWMPPHEAVLVAAASRLVATAAELVSGLIGAAIGSRARSERITDDHRN